MKTVLFLLMASSLWGMSALDLVEKINSRNDGQHMIRKLKMVLTDKRGKTRVNKTISYRKYYGDDKKTLIIYNEPKRLKGTAFLTYDNLTKDDTQWLYLPSLRKVRRISSADRGDWFLGTDFSYEDIKKETKISSEDYNFKIVREDEKSYTLEYSAKTKEIAKELGYSKVVSKIDKESYISKKTKFYDPRGEPLKTLINNKIEKINGIWTIGHMNMVNHQNSHVSDFYFSDIDYKTDIKDKLFAKSSLKKSR